jgi:hypothetical protein
VYKFYGSLVLDRAVNGLRTFVVPSVRGCAVPLIGQTTVQTCNLRF